MLVKLLAPIHKSFHWTLQHTNRNALAWWNHAGVTERVWDFRKGVREEVGYRDAIYL